MKANALFCVLLICLLNAGNLSFLRSKVASVAAQTVYPHLYFRTGNILGLISSSNAGTIGLEDFCSIIKTAPVSPNLYCEIANADDIFSSYSNNNSCHTGNTSNIGFYFKIDFCTPSTQVWDIQFGIDFGLGSVVKLDNQIVSNNRNDMWWAGNWASYTQLNVSKSLTEGYHTIEVFGAEGCCDGTSSIRYRTQSNQAWRFFTKNNLKTECVAYEGEACDS